MSDCKKLQELSLEELWQLFPIELSTHDPRWKEWADEETTSLHSLLQAYTPRITHIGSTAIPGILAKPIIDILVELPGNIGFTGIKDIMERGGYICMATSATRQSYNKGYKPEGYAERVFHIHMRHYGDNDEILFRDYLIGHPEAAREYEHLKQSLLPLYRNNRDAYTEAKTGFVNKIVKEAKAAL